MEEHQKLKELLVHLKRRYPEMESKQYVDEMMEDFAKWKPFFDEELEYWREQAKELVDNYS